MIFAALLCLTAFTADAATTNAILFVTQVPMPTEINSRVITQSTVNVSSAFGNHLGDTAACGRGGALWIRYSDGTITNLTMLAGYGSTNGFQGASGIAVREPNVHWNGTRALFSMVVGAPTSGADTNQYVWQIYEINNFAVKGQIPAITEVPNQPTNYNNVSPTYGSDGRIIFASDRPRDGSAHLYPLREEYLQQPTVSGLWSLGPNSPNDLFLLEHSPSGSFKPFVDSFGRLLFTRWDHLARDVQAVTDRNGTSNNGVFNYSDETANALVTTNTAELFPEPRPSDTNATAGTNMRGNAFNHFFPWSINQDGSNEEVLNHAGRHELLQQVPSATFTNDPNIVTLLATQRFNQNHVANFFLIGEDPNTPGLLYGIDAPDIGTHTAGQIVTLPAAANVNADVMLLNYITPKTTAIPNPAGLYRNPLPLSNGVLVAVHAAGATTNDFNMGTPTAPLSKYDFRLKTLKLSGGTFVPDQFLTSGFTNTVSYLVGNTTVTYSGPMWELDPVEVAARPMPAQPTTANVAAVEAQVFAEEGVDIPAFQSYLHSNNLALVVSRNLTTRDHADRQQPFNLRITSSGNQTLGATGTVYNIQYMQLFQADQLRGFTMGGPTPHPGRRVLAQPMHDPAVDNPPNPTGPPGSVKLGNDGSMASFVPARRAMSWQTTDTSGSPVVRDRYWVTFKPGEIRTCTSCHGINTTDQAGHVAPTNKPEALRTLLRYWKQDAAPPGTTGLIVFQTLRDGNHEVYSMNPDGSNVKNLSTNPALDAIPRVSYDGTKVVFMSDRGHTGSNDIWVMNSDGSNPVNVTKTNLYGATYHSAVLNADNTKIAFMGPGTNSYDIYVINIDGSNRSNITQGAGGDFPYWSYDSTRIVFGSYRDNNNGEEIYIMNANGSNQQRLTFTSGRDFYPVINPDGTKIAYTADRGGHRQIYLMNVDGSGLTNISNNAFNEQTAYFSPDGKKLSFTSDRDGNSEVYTMNLDGSGETRLTSNTVLEAYPGWGATPPNQPPPPPLFMLTVNSGSGGGSYSNGAVVSIAANAPPAGQVFNQWTGATVANAFVTNTTLTMPSSNTMVTATYKSAPLAGTLQFSAATYSASESNGVAKITVTRTGGSAGAVTVNYATSNGTATAGSDYTPVSGTLSWGDGNTASRTFNVPILNDSLYEANETVNLVISGPTGGAVLGSRKTATLAILNDDPAPAGSLQFSASSYIVNENGGSVTITVTRTGGNAGAVSVGYSTTNGTAIAGSDYTTTSGTLNWINGQGASKSFTIPIVNGPTVENAEYFSVKLSSPTGGATLGSPSTTTVYVSDDDAQPPAEGIIVFQTSRDGNVEVYSMNPDGSALKNLTTNAATDGLPHISFDGTKIAFASDRGHPGSYDIWLMDGDGSDLANLTHTNLPGAALWGPSPNSDGSKVTYMGPGVGDGYDVWVMNADGTNPQNLTQRSSSDSFPCWNDSGTRIVFSSYRDNNNGKEIYVMNSNGTSQTRLTFNSGRDFHGVFSPDGSKVAFTSERDGNREVYLMNADGSNPTNLTRNAATDQNPGFSPDGTRIVFISYRDGNSEIYTMNLDGSGTSRLTTHAALDVYPSWGETPPATAAGRTSTKGPNAVAADETPNLSLDLDLEAPPPSIDLGFTPMSGCVGQRIRIAGVGFTAVTEVRFNGVPAHFRVRSDFEIVARVPRGASTGPITVLAPTGFDHTTAEFVVTPRCDSQ